MRERRKKTGGGLKKLALRAASAPMLRRTMVARTPLKSQPEGAQAPEPQSRTKCTPKMTKRFCKLIKKGLPPDACCDYLGISTASFWTWLRRGEIHLLGESEDEQRDAPYGAFVKAFKKAFAKYRLERIEKLHEDGNRAWYRELAILERRDRKSFGRHEQAGSATEEYEPNESFL